MTRALLKDTLREIRKTFSRFFSIFAIVAIGVGFFAGVRATGADMRLTADRYFDQTQLADVRLLSTLGLSQEDVRAVEALDSSGLALLVALAGRMRDPLVEGAPRGLDELRAAYRLTPALSFDAGQ